MAPFGHDLVGIAQDVQKQFVKNEICFTRLSRWRFLHELFSVKCRVK